MRSGWFFANNDSDVSEEMRIQKKGKVLNHPSHSSIFVKNGVCTKCGATGADLAEICVSLKLSPKPSHPTHIVVKKGVCVDCGAGADLTKRCVRLSPNFRKSKG